MVGSFLVFVDSIMEEQILGALLGVPSSQQAMIMMLQLMNTVSLLGEIFLGDHDLYMSPSFYFFLKKNADTHSKHIGAYPGLPVTAFCKVNFFYKFGYFPYSFYALLCPGLLREPKHSHLKELHRAVKLCEQALVSVDPAISTLGTMQEVCLGQPFSSHSDLYIIYWSVCHIHLYQAHVFRSPSGCAAFLANYNSNSYAKVVFNNEQYNLPPWSISILPDCKNVVFNSATVSFTCAYFQYGTFSSSCISPLLFPRTV